MVCVSDPIKSRKYPGTGASASQLAGISGGHHHAWLLFVFDVEVGFLRVGQADLDLLTS